MTENNWPPKFTIDQESILNLFTGETFYSNVDASIREAVLNAVDAIGRRRDAEPSVTPKIQVVFDRQSLTVTVTDNGDGMGKDQITELFTKIGASASKVAGESQDGQYTAVGEFGIGILSYFLTCERFQLHSKKNGNDPLGLEFSRTMLDAKSPACMVDPRRHDEGTELVLSIEKEDHFNRLLQKFPHWMRDVEGLSARKDPEGEDILQGGLSREIKPVDIDKPDWIHEAHIGPPVLFTSWDTFDGSAYVDILYRGVFVAEIIIDHLWAIAGAIHVDPKYFRPKLNREGFVGEGLRAELEPVLRAAHPRILERAIECVREIFKDEQTKNWSLHRWVTLWLAVPRSGQYGKAAEIWDNEFRNRKAFKLLGSGRNERDVSIQDLENLGQTKIYVAPPNLAQADQIIQQAVRVLRDSDNSVVQGINRESNFLKKTSLSSASTGDLLVNHFREILPALVQVETIAQDVIRQDSAVRIFEDPPDVKVVHLGPDATPIIPVGQEIWINIDSEPGKQIVQDICRRNEGHLGLWIACLQHAREYAQQIARTLSNCPVTQNKLGPVKRQFLMGLTH